MDFLYWSTKEPLSINKYGIPEPSSDQIVYPSILLVPLVAFDNNLNRTVKYDEQTYNESKFLYKKDTLGGLFNSSIFLLKHVDYSIEEINE